MVILGRSLSVLCENICNDSAIEEFYPNGMECVLFCEDDFDYSSKVNVDGCAIYSHSRNFDEKSIIPFSFGAISLLQNCAPPYPIDITVYKTLKTTTKTEAHLHNVSEATVSVGSTVDNEQYCARISGLLVRGDMRFYLVTVADDGRSGMSGIVILLYGDAEIPSREDEERLKHAILMRVCKDII